MAYQSPQGLASLGRNGDSMLVHMSPSEVAGLQGLAMSQGGSLSINPQTGLPEAFKLGGFFKSLLPTVVGGIASMIPGMQFASYPMLTGVLAGAATGALTNKNKLLGAVTGGLGGYSGAGIMNAAKAAGAAMPGVTNAANTTAGIGGGSSGLATGGGYIPGATSASDLAYNNAMLASQSGGAANSAISGASGAMDIDKALAAGNQIGGANLISAPPPTFGANMSQAGQGALGAATGNQAAIDAYTKAIGAESALGALGKTALPFGGAAITGGLEASDLYGEPVQNASKEEKYDPYSRLNLGNDTGLRLVAKGGYIDGYANGGIVSNPSVGSGISDLYNRPEGQTTESISNDGYGIGRLNSLANAESMNNAKTLGYAEGGVATLELQDPTATPEQPVTPEVSVINEVAKTQANENQMNNLGLASLGSGNVPTNNYAPGSLATIANAMKNQPVAPEAAFVQNLTSARTGYAKGGYLDGQGDGMSDSIPATIEGKQPARLADGEFVIPADVVSHMGNGSTKAGSKRLYAMLDRVRKARTGHTKQGKKIKPEKYMPA
jgi:hypothetical protein